MVNFTIFNKKNNKPLGTWGIRIDYFENGEKKIRTKEEVEQRILWDGVMRGMGGEIKPEELKRFNSGKIRKKDFKFLKLYEKRYRILVIYDDVIDLSKQKT